LSAKVFVTGGTGFLGSYIIKELVERGYHVKAIRRKEKKLPFYIPAEILNKAEWVEGDVLDIVSLEEATAGMDYIIHAAGIVSFWKKEKKQMYKVNVEGTANVVNAALSNNIKRFVHISSIAAIGRNKDGGKVDETKKWDDNKINTPYARSKQKAEMEIWRGSGEGLNTVILNPSTIIGYGDWNTSSCAVFKNVYNEFGWYSDGINGFVDVEDAAKATVLMMENDITNERFIVNGDNWVFKQLLDTMAEGFGKKKPGRKITPLLASVGWRIDKLRSFFTGQKPLLTKESAKVALSKTIFENDKILKALSGFSFTPLEESIKKACKKYNRSVNGMQP
jgi:nucleoside-diphosphate-sugar epimerase